MRGFFILSSVVGPLVSAVTKLAEVAFLGNCSTNLAANSLLDACASMIFKTMSGFANPFASIPNCLQMSFS